MKGRVGTKTYDTEKAELIDTLPDGVQVYRKNGQNREFFLYNPTGSIAKERFFDLPEEQSAKYLPNEEPETKTHKSTKMIQLSPANSARIKRLAHQNGMSMQAFVMMLVDRYEVEQDRG